MLAITKRRDLIDSMYNFKNLIERSYRGEIILNYENMILSLLDILEG